MSLSVGYLQTSLVIFDMDRGLAYLECLVSLRMGYMRTSLVILNIDRGLAYLGMTGDFEHGLNADQPAYPEQKQRSGLHWRVSVDFEKG